ncbi:MAG: hypothetical protein C0404_07230 [Verrucomicrobia bacterium]|nr:hypothetical protein [Verrucomicrobiota bacterium]
MIGYRIVTLTSLAALACSFSLAEDRFAGEIKIPGGLTAVVAEGNLEPGSIGTYTIRIYRDLKSGAYITGIIREREGAVKGASAVDLDKDGKQEIAVEIEVGSSKARSLDVFNFSGGRLLWNARLSKDAAAGADDKPAPPPKTEDKPAAVEPVKEPAEKTPAPAEPAKEPAEKVADPADPQPAKEEAKQPADAATAVKEPEAAP